jgi:hypothetical protein
MKKLLLTSPKFDGEICVLYDTEGKLALVDLQGAECSEKQIDYLIRMIPAKYVSSKEMLASLESKTLRMIEADYEVGFEMFWTEYDQKNNKQRCIKLWDRLSEADKVKAFVGIKKYKRHLQLNVWKNQADPDTYLRNRYWENQWK